jgi:malonate decarboxylase delta subunit
MEKLNYEYQGGRKLNAVHAPTIACVLSSGNLEVLVEPQDLGGRCNVEVLTAAHGFGPIWEAVLDDFFARHALADVRISINDAGATPAVVSLRLDQAVEQFLGGQA